MRLRNFGKFFIGKEINPGTLGNKANSKNLMSFGTKNQKRSTNIRSGKNASSVLKNKSSLIMSSCFMNHYKIQEEIKMHKGLFEKYIQKLR